MNRVDVVSDMMSSVGYDPTTAVLEVEFRSGSVYQYFDVPPDHYVALLAATSKGRFFNARLRPVFRCLRIE
jgi:hypothetical protein